MRRKIMSFLWVVRDFFTTIWIWPVSYKIQAIKWSYQRMIRGWSDRDLWDFDSHISGILAGGLRRLAQMSYDRPFESNKEIAIESYEAWKAEINHAADLFQEIVDGDFGLSKATNNYTKPVTKTISVRVYAREAKIRKEALKWLLNKDMRRP